MSRQLLRFTVHRAATESDLREACAVRATSYGRRLPDVKRLWTEPDALDRDPETSVFIATCKDGGEAVGTVRLSTNALGPTQIERHAPVPEGIAGRLIAEVTRLAVLPGHADPAVKLGLMKAIYLYSLAHQVRWMVIGARSDALVRQYQRLGFTDVAQGRSIPLAHAADIPHRLLAFDVAAAERNWQTVLHPFYDFMAKTYHPDIQPLRGRPAVEAPRRVANG